MGAVHATFTITRELPHAAIRRETDFRVDGGERLTGRWKSGRVTDFNARYLDIVPQRRIVYAYSMQVDGNKISVSLATILFEPANVRGEAGTRMTVTEQGAFLDGYDDAGSRERGTGALMDRLAKSLEA